MNAYIQSNYSVDFRAVIDAHSSRCRNAGLGFLLPAVRKAEASRYDGGLIGGSIRSHPRYLKPPVLHFDEWF